MVKRGTEAFQTRVFAYPQPHTTGTQYFLLNPGEFDGKINSYVRAVLSPGFNLPFHVHNDCEEVFVIIHGHAVYTDNEKNTHTLNAGDVAVCRCGEGHAIGNPFSEPAILMELNMPVDLTE